MDNKSNSAFIACRGLSFIDLDGLNDEDYQMLNRITSATFVCSGVQFPDSMRVGTISDAECGRPSVHFSITHSEDATSCSAEGPQQFLDVPDFNAAVPPPPLMGYSIPAHHWTHGDSAVGPLQEGGYCPFMTPEAYMFPDPASAADGEAEVSYIPTFNGCQSVYPVQDAPGYHIPPPYHTASPPQEEPSDHTTHVAESVDTSASQYPIHSGMILPAASPMHSTAMTYIPVMSPVMPMSQNPYDVCMVFVSHHAFIPPSNAVNAECVFGNDTTDTQALRSHLDFPLYDNSQSLYEPVMYHQSPPDLFMQQYDFDASISLPEENTLGDIGPDVDNLTISEPQDGHYSQVQHQNTDACYAMESILNYQAAHSTDGFQLKETDISSNALTSVSNTENRINELNNYDVSKPYSSLFGSKSSMLAMSYAASSYVPDEIRQKRLRV